MSKKVTRYLIWSFIAAILFSVILFFFYNTAAIFYIMAAIAILGLLKDSIDYYRMANGQHPLGDHSVEHLPLMIIISLFSAFMLFNSGDLNWAAILIAAGIDSAIDFSQDMVCC